MISLIPSPALPSHLAKGHASAQYRDSNSHFPVRRSLGVGGWSMKTSEDVRQYTAEQGIAEEEALAKGMEEKSKEFAEAGTEVYVPA